jgi:glutamyl-tRNA reductase
MERLDLSSFFVVGISYRKTDVRLRGLFAITPERQQEVLLAAGSGELKEFFVLSTCNRTEIYGFAEDAKKLQYVLCCGTEGGEEAFNEFAYVFNGVEAVRHLYQVATGLDSQILGDYEIIGQLRNSVKAYKAAGFVGSFLERMVNEALRATKRVRTYTDFSSGTVSVSFAAVQFIKQYFPDFSDKKILLLGTGKIGNHTCKYLVDYLPGAQICLMNRTLEKAQSLADTMQLQYASMELLSSKVDEADVILVATGAAEPLILQSFFKEAHPRLIIDFSIPCNVASDVKEVKGLKLVEVDELSKIKDDTLQKRMSEIPKVKQIVEEHVQEYLQWHAQRRHVPLLQAVKNKLMSIHQENTALDLQAEHKIQKVVNGVAVKMRDAHLPGCHYIEAINDFMTPNCQS